MNKPDNCGVCVRRMQVCLKETAAECIGDRYLSKCSIDLYYVQLTITIAVFIVCFKKKKIAVVYKPLNRI